MADPTRPERTVRFKQFIRGREVRWAAVNISIDTRTNEVTRVAACFLPDRGLDHEPRLSAAQAQAKAEVLMRQSPFAGSVVTFANEHTPRLAYAFEEIGEFGALGGALVWVFQAKNAETEWTEVSVSSATGEVVPRRDINAYWYMTEVPTPVH